MDKNKIYLIVHELLDKNDYNNHIISYMFNSYTDEMLKDALNSYIRFAENDMLETWKNKKEYLQQLKELIK